VLGCENRLKIRETGDKETGDKETQDKETQDKETKGLETKRRERAYVRRNDFDFKW
jgi:hypothetical protein